MGYFSNGTEGLDYQEEYCFDFGKGRVTVRRNLSNPGSVKGVDTTLDSALV
jgi:hypothetical protein